MIFKQPEKNMHGEGPVLLSTMKLNGPSILQQLRTDLIESATNHGFKLVKYLLITELIYFTQKFCPHLGVVAHGDSRRGRGHWSH